MHQLMLKTTMIYYVHIFTNYTIITLHTHGIYKLYITNAIISITGIHVNYVQTVWSLFSTVFTTIGVITKFKRGLKVKTRRGLLIN